jgi:hypothetical protein
MDNVHDHALPTRASRHRRLAASATLLVLLALGPALAAGPVEASGTIAAVDADAGTVTIATADGGTLLLNVIDDTRIMVSGKAGALLDLKKDQAVRATYTEAEKGSRVATTITVPKS